MFTIGPRLRRKRTKSKTFYFLLFVFDLSLALVLCVTAEELEKTGTPSETRLCDSALKDIWDPARYIGIDEIQPGMEAYCLTCYTGTEIEKFDLDVLSVVRNVMPGRDWILVQGTDERFIRTGPVGGCSGSPVYIDGRLAGALAYAPGWPFSKDPLYGVTPIEEMLKVGQGTDKGGREPLGSQVSGAKRGAGQMGLALDFSKPIDFAEIDKQITTPRPSANISLAGVTALPCPLITSRLPAEVCGQLDALVKPFGLMVVSGVGGGGQSEATSEDVQLRPGACLVVPLVTGDIDMKVLGTVTEVVGDKVYGFGHSFLGYGAIDLPIATGKVHTVVSSLARSHKLASAVRTVGALTMDESAAIFGRIGAKAKMIPLTITVDRYNDVQQHSYDCQIVDNRPMTPMYLGSVVAGAALMLGDLPPNHVIEYKAAIGIDGFEPITFDNVSTGFGVNEMVVEIVGSIGLLMYNPYKEVNIQSLDFDVRIGAENTVSHIWSVNLSDTKVKAGQEIKIGAIVESFLAGKKEYQFSLKIPDELAPGKYDLTVCGPYEYERFLRKAVPYRFVAQDLSSLLEALNTALGIRRDRLYCLLGLPAGGVTLERAELPDLPGTKALVLYNARRTLRIQPYPHWLEQSLETGTVVVDKKVIRLTVER